MEPEGIASNAWNVLASIGALTAFLIAFFTLVGEVKKSPYIINSLFSVILVCLLGAIFEVAAILLAPAAQLFFWLGLSCLLVALFLTFLKVYKIWVRFKYFVDHVSVKNTAPIRWVRSKWRLFKKDIYAHSAPSVPRDVVEATSKIIRGLGDFNFVEHSGLGPTSLAVATGHQGQANDLLIPLAEEFLKQGNNVQYTSASRHPIEFASALREHLKETGLDWERVAQQIVAVDAFTPHFGFTDSICSQKSTDLKNMNIACVKSKVSFAGVHTASSQAFNTFKRNIAPSNQRVPTLVIYEDMHALCDLESAEQYRIFVRHVIPSERLWGGMFTVFIAANPTGPGWQFLQSFTSMTLDFRENRECISLQY